MPESDGKLPGAMEFELAMGKCPNGHKLPRRGVNGRCTAMYCEKDHKPKPKPAKVAPPQTQPTPEEVASVALARVDGVDEVGLQAPDPGADENEVVRMGNAAGRFAARMSFLKVPKFKDVKEGEEWSDRKIAELLPVAVATKEAFLKFGDDKQRDKAADDILAANGRTRRDIGGNSGPAIVIMTNDGKITVPWAQRKEVKVIDGEVSVDAKE